MASIKRRTDGVYRARYRDAAGREHAKHFKRKVDGQQWLDEVTASLITGNYVDPASAKTTVEQWCDTWLTGYETHRPNTLRAAKARIAIIKAEFGPMPLSAVRPSHVRTWTAQLGEKYKPSTVYGIYRMLVQVMGDAVLDGLIPRSPCSRKTSPGSPSQRPYVATTAQVWALYDAMVEHLRVAILLGAFVGLRTGEVCGLRVADVDFMRGIVNPTVQYAAEALKSETSKTPVPIPSELALQLSAHVATHRADTVVPNASGRQLSPRNLTWHVEQARRNVPGLSPAFRFQDLRHYFASMLIASGADVKIVQARLRHKYATTTLNTYSHLWPDSEQSTRTAVAAVLTERADCPRTKAVEEE